ncbi:MAG: 7-beta-(4-carbaxybutanamido)cephalosporanic acid acylase [Candidatus Hydrogenedentota bacterium]
MVSARTWFWVASLGLAAITVGCGPKETADEAPVEPSAAVEPAAPADSSATAEPSVPEAATSAEPATESTAGKDATIYRDTWGVPHIYAETETAAAYALGYAQAEDRLGDIHDAVRTGLGRMAEAHGKEYIDQDYIMQMVKNPEVCEAQYAKLPANLQAMLTNFVAGVKAYSTEHPDKVPAHAMDIEPWHILTIGRAMIMRWPLGTIQDDIKNDKRSGDPQRPPMQSNEWSVAPSRTADNTPFLLTDPHLSWEGLAVFYEARVHGGDLHMNGYFLVGSPLMGLGHNMNVGFAPTTGGPDTGDAYKIKVNLDNKLIPKYEYDGEWRNAQVKLIKINVKDGEPVTRPAAYTHLGPVMSEPDTATMTAIVGASPYFEKYELFEQSYKMCMAKDADEMYEAIGMLQLMEQNLMFADTKGTIGYVRNGATPIRPEGYDWNAPVPGDSSRTAWKGIHPIGDLVQAINPAAGYMQNCNISPANMMVDSPMTPDKYPSYIYNVSWDTTNPRGDRSTAVLHGDDSITVEEAKALATDIHDLLAAPWQSALRTAVKNVGAEKMKDPEFAAAVTDILAWDGEFTTDATATVLYKFWRLKCNDKVNVGAIRNGEELAIMDQAVFLQLLSDTIAEMKTKYGKWDIAWGEVHRVGRGGKYYPVPGADFGGSTSGPNFSETLFDVRCSEDKEKPGYYIADNGTMALMLMQFHPDRVESWTVTPWGQSADPESPHYMDQGEKLYSKRELKSTWWSKEALTPNIASEKVLTAP